MGLWSGIKYALNSTLGTDKFMPLDKMVARDGYTTFDALWDVKPVEKTVTGDVYSKNTNGANFVCVGKVGVIGGVKPTRNVLVNIAYSTNLMSASFYYVITNSETPPIYSSSQTGSYYTAPYSTGGGTLSIAQVVYAEADENLYIHIATPGYKTTNPITEITATFLSVPISNQMYSVATLVPFIRESDTAILKKLVVSEVVVSSSSEATILGSFTALSDGFVRIKAVAKVNRNQTGYFGYIYLIPKSAPFQFNNTGVTVAAIPTTSDGNSYATYSLDYYVTKGVTYNITTTGRTSSPSFSVFCNSLIIYGDVQRQTEFIR